MACTDPINQWTVSKHLFFKGKLVIIILNTLNTIGNVMCRT